MAWAVLAALTAALVSERPPQPTDALAAPILASDNGTFAELPLPHDESWCLANHTLEPPRWLLTPELYGMTRRVTLRWDENASRPEAPEAAAWPHRPRTRPSSSC